MRRAGCAGCTTAPTGAWSVEATERGQERYLALLPEVARLNDMLVQDLSATEVEQLRGFLARIEQRGRRMAEDNIVSDKASRRAGGTRRAGRGPIQRRLHKDLLR